MIQAQSTHDQHQTRGGACIASGRPLPAADQCQDRMASRHAGIASLSPRLVTSRGFGLGALSPNSHRSVAPSADRGRTGFVGLLLPVGQAVRPTHKAERVVAARCVSASGVGSRPSGRNRLAHQPLIDPCAAALVHIRRLSSSLSSRWIDPNEIGLTHAQIVFAPGAKAND